MFPLLAVAVPGTTALVTFLIVAVVIAFLIAWLPSVVTLDAKIWSVVRVVAVLAILLYALAMWGVI